MKKPATSLPLKDRAKKAISKWWNGTYVSYDMGDHKTMALEKHWTAEQLQSVIEFASSHVRKAAYSILAIALTVFLTKFFEKLFS